LTLLFFPEAVTLLVEVLIYEAIPSRLRGRIRQEGFRRQLGKLRQVEIRGWLGRLGRLRSLGQPFRGRLPIVARSFL
jgi:hypothetical protein